MQNGVKAVCWFLLLGVCVLAAIQFLGRRNRADKSPVELPALRVELKELVAEGRLTEAEARVRLAEALAKSKRQERGKGRIKLTFELEALGTDLKGEVEKGELTEEEAKAKWTEATRQLTGKAGGEDSEPEVGSKAMDGGKEEPEGPK